VFFYSCDLLSFVPFVIAGFWFLDFSPCFPARPADALAKLVISVVYGTLQARVKRSKG